MSHRQLIIAIAALLTFGCRHDSDTTVRQMDRPVGGSAQKQSDAMENLVLDIMRAPTPAAEADALRKLHVYQREHGLTYTVRTIRTYDNVPIAAASVGKQPVRAELTIFRGRDVVRTFNFVPQDNRNLALLGE